MKSTKNEFNDISVSEVLPDVWMLGGYISCGFFAKAPSSNVYVFRDDNTVYILDPGKYPVYKKKIIEIINMYKKNGVTKAILLVTQGHFDHAVNSDVVKELGIEWEFYIPEEEMPTMNCFEDFFNDIHEASKYEDVFTTMFPKEGFSSQIRRVGRISPVMGTALLKRLLKSTMGKGNHLADEARLLKANQRIKKEYGSVTLEGWEMGRFFISFDGAHSPGHICVYDPKYKIMFAGDTTIEVNPPFCYSSMNKLIDITEKYKIMAHEGYIEYTLDAHRSNKCFNYICNYFKKDALSEYELIEYAKSCSESEAFFDFFNTYYKEMKNEVLLAHRRIGKSTVGDIVNELYKSDNKYTQFKAALKFPEIPSRMDVLVIQVLKEAGAVPVSENGKILFQPKC